MTKKQPQPHPAKAQRGFTFSFTSLGGGIPYHTHISAPPTATRSALWLWELWRQARLHFHSISAHCLAPFLLWTVTFAINFPLSCSVSPQSALTYAKLTRSDCLSSASFSTEARKQDSLENCQKPLCLHCWRHY